jgi:curved DNA-binding protein CbpA
MAETYYELLEVPPDASADEIRSAYRAKVKETHPDVSDDPDATDRFQRVQRAREVLTDETKRARYDRLGHEAFVDGVVNPATDPAPDDAPPDATAASESTTGPADSDESGPTETGSHAGASAGAADASAAGHTGSADGRDRAGWRGGDDRRTWVNDEATRGDQQEEARTGGGSAYATRTSASHRSYDGVRVPLTPRTAVTLITTFVLYPVFVFASILPRFPLTVNIVLACCTLFVIAYLISMPEIAIVVFGAWSVLAPLLLLSVESLSLFSLVGMIALVATWFPLGLAFLARSALRL